MARRINCPNCKHSCEAEYKARCILAGKCDKFEPINKPKPRIIFLDDMDFHEKIKKKEKLLPT